MAPTLPERVNMAEHVGFVVVAFSPQPSLAYFMKGVLDCAGFQTVAASSSLDELEALLLKVRPDAVVYDVSYPFAENWRQLEQLKSRSALRDIPIVLTTSEARELARRVGVSNAIEMFTRPSDLAAFQTAVRRAIEEASHAA
jgi:CheY-like chemotaxis protein